MTHASRRANKRECHRHRSIAALHFKASAFTPANARAYFATSRVASLSRSAIILRTLKNRMTATHFRRRNCRCHRGRRRGKNVQQSFCIAQPARFAHIASANAIKKALRLRSIINNYKDSKKRNYLPLINKSQPASSRPPTTPISIRVSQTRIHPFPWPACRGSLATFTHSNYFNSPIPRNVYFVENTVEKIANEVEDNTGR